MAQPNAKTKPPIETSKPVRATLCVDIDNPAFGSIDSGVGAIQVCGKMVSVSHRLFFGKQGSDFVYEVDIRERFGDVGIHA
jgi:hypothetical protein